jgi:hypothetical protein
MPTSFLPSIRMSCLLNESRGSRPFGMPDVDSGGTNLAELIRQIGPISESLNNDEMRRKQQMMQFEQSMSQQSRSMQTEIPNNNIIRGKKNVV